MSPSNRRELAWFLGLLVLFSGLADALIIWLQHGTAMTYRMLMWCPGAAALVACVINRVDIRSLGWSWPAPRYVASAYLLPWLYAIPVYGLTWLFAGSFDWVGYSFTQAQPYGMTEHAGPFTALFSIPTLLSLGVLGSMTSALGEELGWRGFLVRRLLQRFGLLTTGLISGLIWAVWHYPALLGADYNAGTNPVYAVVCFTGMVVAMGVLMAWLRVRSDSLWPCVLLHASHNTLIQGVLDGMTAKGGISPYVTTEFGVGLAVSVSTVVFVLMARQRARAVQ